LPNPTKGKRESCIRWIELLVSCDCEANYTQGRPLMRHEGGRAGTGKTKHRGKANYYRDMQKKSVEVRIRNKNPDKTED
jgi:hypothetical protein